jgi:hypothetical protein
VVLRTTQFKWFVRKCEPADEEKRKDWFQEAVKNDAVGRKVKIFSKPRRKRFHGTIIAFEEARGKHKIQFDKPSTVKSLHLEKQRWRYNDIIRDTPRSGHTLSISRYAGVMRNTDLRWHAFRGRKGVDYIGTFTSEKDAALAHDFYARKAGDKHLIYFPRKQMSEKDIQKRKTKQYEGVTLPTKGKSIYRGVHLQKNLKR